MISKTSITKENYEQFLTSNGVKILLFGLKTNTTVKLESIIKSISEIEFEFGFCDYEKNKNIASSFTIRKLPAAFIYVDGSMMGMVTLPTTKEDILKLCETNT